jgi:superfamily II RNA helicase
MNAAAPLAEQLFKLPPRPEEVTGDDVLTRFLEYVKDKGLSLYAAQEEAIMEVALDANVILATPTGSGKSLVATAMHFHAMARRRRSIYTSPIKALASEKFFALCKEFGADDVGMLTGDAAINRDAPILCCTAEVLANMALREGADADVDYVIMDEFHYYADRDRGVAWQVPLLTLPNATFLLMSATLGDVALFEEKLTALNGKRTAVVRSTERPVPLDFSYRETPLHETILELTRQGRAPIYVVSFTQRGCAEEAQNLMSVDYSTKEEKKAIAAALEGFRFDSPYGKELQRFIRHGIGIHHAGLLPKYRLLVEKLAQKGYLKIICGTDTLGVGVNIPIRTVLFTKLCKYDGEKTSILRVRDFLQISGRAGRKGFDDRGSVVAQAPEHVIENLRLEAKAGNDPAKRRKLVKKKPPEKGYVHWDKATFDRLVVSPPEALESRFAVSHGMLLNVLERGRGCRPIARLIRDSHERMHAKRQHGRTAIAMFKSLREAGVIEVVDGKVVVNADLQEDFSLNHALSLYLVETIDVVPESEDPRVHALDVLTLVESILESPDIVLMKQLDKLKTEKMAEMKAAGIEYEERIAELEKMEHPKPNAEFIYETFNAFAKKHPWIGENIRPKSIARDMFEKFMSFGEYVREYELQRSEGVLLRYLSDVYKALVQAVPAPTKTPEVDEIETYFAAIVRAADSSLLDEWEKMRGVSGERATPSAAAPAEGEPDITRDEKQFTVLVRNAVFAVLRAIARKEWSAAAEMLAPREGDAWTADRIAAAFAPFFAAHAAVRIDPAARAPANTRVTAKDANAWKVEQVIVDAEDANDWALSFVVPMEASAREGRAVLDLAGVIAGG